ncbi:PAAR-like domain-containing protein [Neorhizobium sp. T6_25]|uniref:PAAR-like domain-containing protein n=1 Tax=Neorhizobium sp. T6_25 TaxID=2093833 RepID=UPI00155EFD11|nr:PAAR-like domain-containing protein [Neorhizobium sp. T6_25]
MLYYDGPWPPPKKEEEKPASQPRPAAPAPAPPEIIPDNKDALALSLSPDVCRAPDKPCPFPAWGKADDDTNYSPDVFANGERIKHHESKFSRCYGDEPGVGLGCKSGTVGDVVEPVTSSPILTVNGKPVQRHADLCTLNNGNTDGEYCYVRATDIQPPPNATDGQDKAWYEQAAGDFWSGMTATSDEAALLDGAVKKAGQWFENPSQFLDDVKGAYDSIPTGAELWQGAQNIGSGLLNVGEQVVNDPIGSAKSAGGWAVDQVEGAIDSVEQGYEKHGVAGAAGAGVGVLASIFSPGKKIKALKEAGEALEEAGDAASAIHKAERAEDAVDDANVPQRHNQGENADGKDGGRVTRRFQVECFDVPDKLKGKTEEYKRQLAEQMDYINNNMTADDMAYSHWVLDKAGGTEALRQPYLQQKHRNLYKQYLRSQGQTEAQIADAVEGKAATHFLDMIAGGNPAIFSTDAAGNPVLGDSEVNSYIGNQWTQKSRAASLKEEAEQMRNSGRSGEKMNVELKVCE